MSQQMIDPFGRTVSYLRVSVTDRCDFRCVYCMAEDMTFLPKREVLSLEELDRLCSAFIVKGVRKLRLTGGEPLVRKNIMSLIRSLSRHIDSGDLEELTITTNGSQLARYASELYDCGVRRINVSIDTLDPARFRAITRWGDLAKVMDGIRAATEAGLSVKINMVALKGVNEHEIVQMLEWCHGNGYDLTLIETMPLGEIEEDRTDQYLPLSLVRANLAERLTLEDIPYKTGGPARYVRIAETGGRLGFITPMTHNFCESCNRVRVTCTGMLYMCLGQDDSADLRAALRASESDELLYNAIDEAIGRKPKGHDFIIDRRTRQPAVSRHMSVTGG
ncbi:GTP 3',8-cyclase MoaA [Stappia indica]|uniref:GTP 3',8-cyclase n=1 Tax=Stappia indica TaxID=538381 RepID=A0A285S9C4_9HYPH|nr:GTP 3',8-cyclase MoaA [Stappia indica]MCC4245849.1 GTP 3',8-cyclase MoaA [Stappia indica]SOC04192.1 cyclic pyranopterin monophosphate synthase subunit MoaA [Stappia indica]